MTRRRKRARDTAAAACPPVTVEVVQLLLHLAADAAAVMAVQPLAHHAHAVLPLVPVECEVLDTRRDSLAALGAELSGQPRARVLLD